MEDARTIAEQFVSLIESACERVMIVGSLRRNKPTVNDIDVVAIPKYEMTKDDTLFGEPTRLNLLESRIVELCVQKKMRLEASGSKIKRFVLDGQELPIDLYIANAETWWTLVLIRTGSKEHNIFLAQRAQELHMQFKANGDGLVMPGGTLMRITSEEQIFETLHLPYKRPEQR